jgi:hypothetical protein
MQAGIQMCCVRHCPYEHYQQLFTFTPHGFHNLRLKKKDSLCKGGGSRVSLPSLLDQLDLGYEAALQKFRLLVPNPPFDIVGPLQADSDIITTRHTAQTSLRAGPPRDRGSIPSRGKDFSLLESVQKNYGPTQGHFPPEPSGWDVKLTTNPHVVTRLRMSGTILLFRRGFDSRWVIGIFYWPNPSGRLSL